MIAAKKIIDNSILILLAVSFVIFDLSSGAGKIYAANEVLISPSSSAVFDKVYNFDGIAVYTDNTSEAGTSDGTPFAVLTSEGSSNDEFYIGLDHSFNAVRFDISSAGVGIVLSAQYYSTNWSELTIADNTSNLAGTGTITFAAPGDWTTTSVNGATKYWVRFRSPAANITVAPMANSVVSPGANVAAGSSFVVDIVVDPNNPDPDKAVYALQTDFEFDPSLAQVNNPNGITLGSAMDPFWSLTAPTIDNVSGKITLIDGILNSALNTSFTFVTINMTALAAVYGNSYLRLPDPDHGSSGNSLIILDFYVNTLPYIVTNSSVAIGSDLISPTINSIATSHADGSYKSGEIIDFTVTYDEAVNVVTSGGTPSLALNSGGSAVYNSGTGTNILAFRYAAGAGENSTDLDYLAINSLALNAGTIKDAAGNNADNTLPAVGTFAASHAIAIDTTSSIISEITPVSTPTNDNTPNYIFTSDEAGAITYGGDCSSATTSADVGANTITFNTLADGSHSNCTIRVTDAAGNPSNLLAVTAFAIDTTAPEFSSVTPAASSSINNVTSSSGVGYTLDEAIASGTITITRTGGTADVSSPHTCDLAGTAKNSGAHTINLSDTTNGCAVAQTLVSGTIYTFAFDGVDVVGNPAIQVSRTDVTFDNIAPADITTLSVSSPTTSSLVLTWTSPGNDGTNGTAAGYDLRYLTSAITDSNWTSAAQASGEPAPQIAGTSQNMTVSGLSSGTTYYFAVKTTDAAGNQSGLSNIASGSTQSFGGGGGGGGGYIPTGPTNVSIIINNNAVSADSTNVNLTLSAVNAPQMTISNNSDFSNSSWEPYNTSKTWILTSGNGAKTVYAKFKDSQGYSSQTVSDNINLAIAENSSPDYPDGTLLKSSLSSEIYVIKSGQKEWIKSVEEFNAGGYKWENIKVISQEELSSIPAYSGGGSTASNPSSYYPEGTLLKTTESFRVYVIISGKKKWISTPEVFETLGYEWGNIKIVAKSDLDKVADYEDNLMRAIGDYKVYLVVNGIKRHIPNPEIFLNYGFSWGDVKDVSQSVVDKYQRAYIIRESGQGKIYYLDPRGIKKHIPSPEVFASYNNKWEDIQVISKKEMDSYSESNLIRLAGDDRIYLVENNIKRWIPTAGIFNKNGYNWNLITNVNKPEFDYYKKGADLK